MEWFRDLVIIIFGLTATAALVIQTVLWLKTYRGVREILDSVRATTRTVENITQTVDAELAGPLGQIVSVLRGLREGLGFFSSFRSRKKKGKS
jgi:hypothetical protein